VVKRAILVLAVAGCGKFQDPNVVVDLRVIAMKASVPVGKCGPCVSMTPIGNRTAAPRLAAAAICGAVMSAIVSDRRAI